MLSEAVSRLPTFEWPTLGESAKKAPRPVRQRSASVSEAPVPDYVQQRVAELNAKRRDEMEKKMSSGDSGASTGSPNSDEMADGEVAGLSAQQVLADGYEWRAVKKPQPRKPAFNEYQPVAMPRYNVPPPQNFVPADPLNNAEQLMRRKVEEVLLSNMSSLGSASSAARQVSIHPQASLGTLLSGAGRIPRASEYPDADEFFTARSTRFYECFDHAATMAEIDKIVTLLKGRPESRQFMAGTAWLLKVVMNLNSATYGWHIAKTDALEERGFNSLDMKSRRDAIEYEYAKMLQAVSDKSAKIVRQAQMSKRELQLEKCFDDQLFGQSDGR
jgi:hypothetical protein